MRIEHLPADNAGRLNPVYTREQAWELLHKYNRESFHIQHAETVEAVMRYFAGELGYAGEADFWGLVASKSAMQSGRSFMNWRRRSIW